MNFKFLKVVKIYKRKEIQVGLMNFVKKEFTKIPKIFTCVSTRIATNVQIGLKKSDPVIFQSNTKIPKIIRS